MVKGNRTKSNKEYNILGNKLKKLRKDKKITQRDLAEQLRVSTGAVGLWEIGRRTPDYKTIVEIAQFFNVSIDYLLGDIRQNKIIVMGSNGTIKTFYLKDKDFFAVEKLAEMLNENNSI